MVLSKKFRFYLKRQEPISNIIFLQLFLDKWEQFALKAVLTIASLCLPIATTEEEAFYVELFLISDFPLELESKSEGHSKQKNTNIYENSMCFKGFFKFVKRQLQ